MRNIWLVHYKGDNDFFKNMSLIVEYLNDNKNKPFELIKVGIGSNGLKYYFYKDDIVLDEEKEVVNYYKIPFF